MRALAMIIILALAGCVTTGGNQVDKSKMAEGYYMKGLSYLQDKNYELASAEFNRSIQTDSNYKQSYYGLGFISDEQGLLDNAIKYYKEAIDLDSNYSEAYNALGRVYSKQQNWKEALKSFRKALENKLYPTPHIAYMNIGYVYMAQKNYEKAAEAFLQAKRFVNQDYIIYWHGTALFEAGKIKEAITEFQEASALAPQNADIRYSLALALLKDGNKKAAVREFKKTTELAPKSEIAQKANDYIKTLR
jgi:type IV pilus assembly protein PilF